MPGCRRRGRAPTSTCHSPSLGTPPGSSVTSRRRSFRIPWSPRSTTRWLSTGD
jgi:hypothetical protein